MAKYQMRVLFFVFYILFTLQVSAQQASDFVSPEMGDLATYKSSVYAKEFIAVTAHPLATKAAYEILKNGGHAIDAMVTVQTILGLVEPQSSGLGGGAFLVYYDASTKRITTFDGRETSPINAPNNLFMAKDGDGSRN